MLFRSCISKYNVLVIGFAQHSDCARQLPFINRLVRVFFFAVVRERAIYKEGTSMNYDYSVSLLLFR